MLIFRIFKMNWTRKFFKKQYILFENNQPIGSIRRKFLASDSACQLRDNTFNFKRVGFVKHRFTVSSEKENHIAEITFARLWTRATIKFKNGNLYHWQVNKLWGHFWSIEHQSKTQTTFIETFLCGTVLGDVSNDVLVLAGLMIKVYFKRAVIFSTLGIIVVLCLLSSI